MWRVSAPGKLVVLGEYAVLRGAAAVVAGMDRRAGVELLCEPDLPAGLLVTSESLGLERVAVSLTGAASDPRLAVVGAVAREVLGPGSNFRGHARIDTSAFFAGELKLGLGSSAAVAVALTGALHEALGRSTDPAAVFAVALGAHRAAQGGTGSGIDVAASGFGGLCEYRIDHPPRVLAMPGDVVMRAVWSGRSASTPGLVRRVLAAVDADPKARAAFDTIGDHAAQGVSALEAQEGNDFLAAVSATYSDLVALGDAAGVELVTSEHAAIAEVVRREGGAYKTSGAGGGDLGLAFATDPEQAGRIEGALAEAGFKVLALGIDDRGIRLET